MDKFSPDLDKTLWDYLDGKLDETRLRELKSELETSAEMKNRLEELRSIHDNLARTKLETPSANFVNKVMQNLYRLPASTSLSPRNGLLLFSGMVVAICILAFMVSAGTFDQFNDFFTLKQAVPEQKFLPQNVPTIAIQGRTILYFIEGAALILSFLILDRTVLRPLFHRRSGMQF